MVLSPDPLGAALIGAAADLMGVRPLFATTDTAAPLLRRERPSLLFIDCGHERSADESLIGPALMMGTRVFLFGDARTSQALRPVAIRMRLGRITLPRDTDDLLAVLSGKKVSREEVEG